MRARLRPLVGPAVNLGVPVLAYYLLILAGASKVTALVVAAALPALRVGYRLVRHRRFDRAAGFALVMVAVGLVAALWTGSVRLVYAKDALFTAAAGGWFLISARGRRPVAMLASKPLLGWLTSPNVSWDELWETELRFCQIWRVSTVIQGVALLADAVVRVWIAYTLPAAAVPAVTTAQYAVFLPLLLVIVNIHQHRAGLFRLLRPWERTSARPPVLARAQRG